jgi:hypothetical protein
MTAFFFPRKTSNRRSNAVLELKEHVRMAINADDETVVSVSERDCGDPGCGGARTVVLIMHPRRPTDAVKIDKPLEQITQKDVSDALASSAGPEPPSPADPAPVAQTFFVDEDVRRPAALVDEWTHIPRLWRKSWSRDPEME